MEIRKDSEQFGLLVEGANLNQVAPPPQAEFLIGIAYALLGFLPFHWFETQARKRGTLETI